MDRATAAALDRYLTREPPSEADFERQPQPHCSACGSFLRLRPHRVEGWEEAAECDGKLKSYEAEYGEATIRIIGEHFRGRTYLIHFYDCGAHEPDAYDVKPGSADHEPHRVVVAAGEKLIRVCSACGHENVEIVA